MGHYAKIIDGIVQQVIIAEKDFIDSYIDNEPGEWIQTSYNTRGNIHYSSNNEPDGGVALRGNFAGIGYTYDRTNDVFYPPKPYESWSISRETNWVWTAPIPCPYDRGLWDESTLSWIDTTDIPIEPTKE